MLIHKHTHYKKGNKRNKKHGFETRTGEREPVGTDRGTAPRLTAPVGGTIHDPGRAGLRQTTRTLILTPFSLIFVKTRLRATGARFTLPLSLFSDESSFLRQTMVQP